MDIACWQSNRFEASAAWKLPGCLCPQLLHLYVGEAPAPTED